MAATMDNMQITKDIVLAMIEKGVLVFPAKANMNKEEIREYNDLRTKEIGIAFETIIKHVQKALKEN